MKNWRKLELFIKKLMSKSLTKRFYDTPLFFNITEVQNALYNLKNETKNSKSSSRYMVVDASYTCIDSSTTVETGLLLSEEEKIAKYFEGELQFHPTKNQNVTKGDYAEGTLDKFFVRFQKNQSRPSFVPIWC